MIRFIEGTVLSADGGRIVVGTASGIGYLVTITTATGYELHHAIQLYTYLAVRETALDLYGFSTSAELQVFELLLTIPKIGPKSAMQIMDQTSLSVLLEAIDANDPNHLTRLSGMGKKTAEKVVAHLRDKRDLFPISIQATPTTSQTYQDAFDTLVALGYNPADVRTTLDTITTSTTSDMVKEALRALA
jgi:holliday junction DNA helicase RuvA